MMKGEQSKPPIEIISSIKSEEEEDRISLLPDCLLVEILSCLPETKYAIRTGALSKRWQHLWPQLPNLILFYYSEELGDCEYNVHQFYSSVERIISQCGQSNLNKFKLHAEYTKNTKYQVRNCIRNAINHNVQEVDFRVIKYPCHCYDEWFVLPEFFFISSSFIHLTLSLCMFKKAYVVSWENLRTLRIEDTEIDHDSIKSILSGSPLLETLMLYHCYGFKQLDITNKSVKNLVFYGYDNALSIYAVAINAPYILSLTIQDRLLLKKLLLLNMSSVIKAELDYYANLEGEGEEDEVNEEMLKGLLLSLGHVKEVKIGDYCLEALARLKAKGFIYPSNLKVLQEIDSN